MLAIPAIDILSGACVRLYQGEYASATSYSEDPASVAASFERTGAPRIHIVDLDAARGGGKDNRDTVRRIRETVKAVIELGGGVRTEADVVELLDMGIDRLVVGSAFVRDPQLVEDWIRRHGRRIIAAIDAREGTVRVDGWETDSSLSDVAVARRAREAGAISIIYTNIKLDGTLTGPDVEGSLRVADASGLPIVVSGGVGGIEDLQQIAGRDDSRIAGVIVGKALYEGRVDLRQALELSSEAVSMEKW